MISLPLLDDVQAAGFTPKQLKADLTQTAGQYIASPEVSVIVQEIHSLQGRGHRRGEEDPAATTSRSRASVLDAHRRSPADSTIAPVDRRW